MNNSVKIKRGDTVIITAGKDKDKKGKVLLVDRKNSRVIVEGQNMITKHMKANQANPQGGLVKKEAPLHISNVMYLHKGKPTRLGYELEEKEVNGKKVIIKHRVAKTTKERID